MDCIFRVENYFHAHPEYGSPHGDCESLTVPKARDDFILHHYQETDKFKE